MTNRQRQAYKRAQVRELLKHPSIDDIAKANELAGFYFFEPDTLRFFSSRIHGQVYGRRYFVTSEQPPYGARGYTVRRVNPSGNIDTIGPFCELTRSRAHTLARDCAEHGETLAFVRARLSSCEWGAWNHYVDCAGKLERVSGHLFCDVHADAVAADGVPAWLELEGAD